MEQGFPQGVADPVPAWNCVSFSEVEYRNAYLSQLKGIYLELFFETEQKD